jgi:hypothetical protein
MFLVFGCVIWINLGHSFLGMTESLSHLWKNFSLSEEESLGVEALHQGLSDVVERGRSCVVGKLFADRVIGKDALKTTLVKWWRPTGMISFKVLEENLFLVEGRLWVFEGNLFAVEDFNG